MPQVITTILPTAAQILPTNLSYFTVKWRALAVIGDGVDAGRDPDSGYFSQIQVTFIPGVDSVNVTTSTPKVTVYPQQFTVGCNANGDLLGTDGSPDVSLLDPTDADLSVRNWTWGVRVTGTSAVSSDTFYITGGGTVDLADYVPVVASPGYSTANPYRSINATVQPNTATDQTAALQAELTAAAALGVPLTGYGTWRINSTLVISSSCDLSGVTLQYYGTGVAVQVGAGVSGSYTDRKLFRLPRVVDMTKPGTGWSAGTVGVKVINVISSEIHVPHVQGFETGLYQYGLGFGNQHNAFYVGHLDNNKVNHDIYQDATGWNNQNTYVVQRSSHNSAEGADVVGTAHLRLRDDAGGNAAPNGNVWVNPSYESPGVVEWTMDIQGGAYNTWIAPRWEFTGGNSKVQWGARAVQNTIFATAQGSEAVVETHVTGSARNSIIGQGSSRMIVTGDTRGGLLLENIASSAQPVMTVLQAGGTVAGDSPVTGYTWRMTAQNLYGKRTTDTYERIRLDPVNGRIYFGQNTATPTAFLESSPSQLRSSGSFGFTTDNTVDIGGAASTRPRTVYAGTDVVAGRVVKTSAVATGSRPTAASAGAGGSVFDTTLNKPIWSTGTVWVDATGTTV